MTNEDKAREIAQVIHDRIREQGFVTTWPWDAGVGPIVAALAEKDAEIERLRERQRNDEDQLVWLADWCRRVIGVESNSVIGREGWPYRLVEVVAKAVEDRLRSLAADPIPGREQLRGAGR